MGKKSTVESENIIPTNYEELYVHYILGTEGKQSLCKQLIKSMYRTAEDDEVENLMHDVFLRCQEFDVLAKFDATKANFGGVIFFVTRSVVRNYQNRRKRDVLGTMRAGGLVEVGDEEDFAKGTYRLDSMFITDDSPDSNALTLDAKVQAEKLLNYAKKISEYPKSLRDKNLFKLLEMMMNEYEVSEMAEKLNVGTSTVHNWMKYLREVAQGLVTGD